MSLITFACLAMLAVMASSVSTPDKPHYDISQARLLFEQFIKDYNRQYKNDIDKEVHFAAFVENLKKINEMNAKSPNAVFGINKFADYTKEEEEAMMGVKPHPV